MTHSTGRYLPRFSLLTRCNHPSTIRALERQYECDVLGGVENYMITDEIILLNMANGTYSHANKRDEA